MAIGPFDIWGGGARTRRPDDPAAFAPTEAQAPHPETCGASPTSDSSPDADTNTCPDADSDTGSLV
ncbi:MAG: hypothetical protein VKP57_09465 [Candidatus Sericytochromatia bacterium]|nr:hypothetical protein [Candidatus Sericytochromatia bacterium]